MSMEKWWNDDVNRRKLLIHPSELSGSPTAESLVAQQEELGKEMTN
jgi:hypothetical protein